MKCNQNSTEQLEKNDKVWDYRRRRNLNDRMDGQGEGIYLSSSCPQDETIRSPISQRKFASQWLTFDFNDCKQLCLRVLRFILSHTYRFYFFIFTNVFILFLTEKLAVGNTRYSDSMRIFGSKALDKGPIIKGKWKKIEKKSLIYAPTCW